VSSGSAKSPCRQHRRYISRSVVSASEDASLAKSVALLERNWIKRIPILCNGELGGIVSRANLIQALASITAVAKTHANGDRGIRVALLAELKSSPGRISATAT
jgi:CBS-domain-containing membrane protein